MANPTPIQGTGTQGPVVSFERVEKAGWGLSMHCVPLPGGGALVQSPTWLGEGTFEKVEEVGEPRVLFAPNHYHHMSIKRFLARYPKAVVVASEQASVRLRKQGHDYLRPLDEAAPLLPEGAHFLACEGTKSGEAWLSVPGEGGPTWITSDAFFNVERPVKGFMGFVLRAMKTSPGFCIGNTFPWLALRDKPAYCAWAHAAIEREKPAQLLVSHGAPLRGPDVASRMDALVRERLG